MKKSLKDIKFTIIYGILDCSNNQLTSLDGCPEGVTTLLCSNNQLTSLDGCPENVTKLYCLSNQLTSLDGCPKNVTELDCSNNQLTSLDGCPENVTMLDYYDNPLNSTYKNKSLKEIHLINYVKKFKKGITIVDNIILNYNARTIQKVWDDWWYKPDKQGESRVAKKQYAKLNYENNLQNKK